MSGGVHAMAWIVAIAILFLGILDINTNVTTKEHMFNSIRSANQNALYDVQSDYEEGKVLSSPEMLEAWLNEFAQDMDMDFKDLDVNFIQMEGDPPVYLVYAEGYKNRYIIVDRDVYISYLSGSTIVQDGEASSGSGGSGGRTNPGAIDPNPGSSGGVEEHQHECSFSYSASGNVLTAKCITSGCPKGYSSGISVSISKPSSLIYNGSTKSCVFSSTELNRWREAHNGSDPICEYYTKDGVKTTAANSGAAGEGKAPVKAGTYVAKIHADKSSVMATLEFTITNSSVSYTAPTAKNLVYTGFAQALVNTGSATGGTMQYKLPSGSGDVNGDGSVNVLDSNIVNRYTEGTVILTDSQKRAADVNGDGRINTTDANLIKNYASKTISEFPASSYSTSIPTAIDAGIYTVYYKVFGDENHSDTDEKTVSVTIAKAASSVTAAPTAKTLTYNGSAQELVNAGVASGGTMQYKLGSGGTYSTSIPTATNAGTYTVYYKVVGDSNHSDTTEKSIRVTIAQEAAPQEAASITKAPTAKNLTYNGSAQALVNAGTASGGTMQYKLGASGSYSTAIPTATNAGTYTVYYKVVGDGTHGDTEEKSVSVTIAKAASSVTTAPTARTGSVNIGSANTLVNAGVASGGTIQYKLGASGTYSANVPTATNTGNYTVYYKIVGDSNHNDTTEQSISVGIASYKKYAVTGEWEVYQSASKTAAFIFGNPDFMYVEGTPDFQQFSDTQPQFDFTNGITSKSLEKGYGTRAWIANSDGIRSNPSQGSYGCFALVSRAEYGIFTWAYDAKIYSIRRKGDAKGAFTNETVAAFTGTYPDDGVQDGYWWVREG